MKRHYYLLGIAAFLLIAAFPALTKAEEGTSTLLNRVRNNIDAKVQNAKINQDLRETKLMRTGSTSAQLNVTANTRLRVASSSDEDRGDRQGNGFIRKGPNASSTLSTSSTMFRNRDDRDDGYRNNRKELLKPIFEAKKNIIDRQLEQALKNLKQIRDRISARIDKATASGMNMTEASKLLVIADQKISVAQSEIDAFASTNIETTSSTATTTASTTIDLTRPRQLAENAKSAIKDVKKALVDVVVAIAHSMGLNLGQTGTTTASSSIVISPETP